jgi:O-succinylbenzoic acid--CoA ligase
MTEGTGSDRDPLRAAAERRPDARALVGADADLTYRELDRAADRLARGLTGAGLGPGDRVACLLPAGAEVVTSLHGVPRVGAALAPLHPEWTEPELDDYLRRVRPRAVLCGPGTEERAAGLVRSSGLLVRMGPPGADGGREGGAGGAGQDAGTAGASVEDETGTGAAVPLAGLPQAERVPGVDHGADHTVLATSGTSGRPRGVRLTLANHLACQRASIRRMELGADDRWLASLSPAHVGGVALVLRAALTGARLVLEEGFDPDRFLALADEGRVTHASLVPTMLHRLLQARGEADAPEGLRGILLGGDAADPTMVERALEAGWPLYPTYGLTEAASQVATATPTEARERPDTVGRPLEGVEVRVRDEEIQVRGPTVAAGYLGAARAPGAVRRGGRVIPRQGEPEPAGTDVDEDGGRVTAADGWLHTGDAGSLGDDGRLRVTGRLAHRIVTGGVTVDPAEVERVLRGHPRVRDACVVGLPDPEWGERVGAAVQRDATSPESDPDRPLDAVGLAAWFGDRLAPAKRPRVVRFVGRIPANANGKPDREAVRDLVGGV